MYIISLRAKVLFDKNCHENIDKCLVFLLSKEFCIQVVTSVAWCAGRLGARARSSTPTRLTSRRHSSKLGKPLYVKNSSIFHCLSVPMSFCLCFSSVSLSLFCISSQLFLALVILLHSYKN